MLNGCFGLAVYATCTSATRILCGEASNLKARTFWILGVHMFWGFFQVFLEPGGAMRCSKSFWIHPISSLHHCSGWEHHPNDDSTRRRAATQVLWRQGRAMWGPMTHTTGRKQRLSSRWLYLIEVSTSPGFATSITSVQCWRWFSPQELRGQCQHLLNPSKDTPLCDFSPFSNSLVEEK